MNGVVGNKTDRPVSDAQMRDLANKANKAADNAPAKSSSETFGTLNTSNLASFKTAANSSSVGTPSVRIPQQDGIDSKVLEAATEALNSKGGDRQCYKVALEAAKLSGHKGDGFSWKENRKYSGQDAITAINTAYANGEIGPGTVIYVNSSGVPTDSLDVKGEKPHWCTIVGLKDGKVMTSDNHANGKNAQGKPQSLKTLEEVMSGVGTKLAAMYDPSGQNPNFKPQTQDSTQIA